MSVYRPARRPNAFAIGSRPGPLCHPRLVGVSTLWEAEATTHVQLDIAGGIGLQQADSARVSLDGVDDPARDEHEVPDGWANPLPVNPNRRRPVENVNLLVVIAVRVEVDLATGLVHHLQGAGMAARG